MGSFLRSQNLRMLSRLTIRRSLRWWWASWTRCHALLRWRRAVAWLAGSSVRRSNSRWRWRLTWSNGALINLFVKVSVSSAEEGGRVAVQLTCAAPGFRLKPKSTACCDASTKVRAEMVPPLPALARKTSQKTLHHLYKNESQG